MDEDDGAYSRSPRPSKPRGPETVSSLLTELRLRFKDGRIGQEEWDGQLRAYLQDLAEQPPQIVMQAIRAGRKHWEWFPKVPEILAEVQRIQSGHQGTGGMGFLGWPRYKAWLQWTGRPSPRPYTAAQMNRLLDKIPDDEMVRLGTPRKLASAAE